MNRTQSILNTKTKFTQSISHLQSGILTQKSSSDIIKCGGIKKVQSSNGGHHSRRNTRSMITKSYIRQN